MARVRPPTLRSIFLVALIGLCSCGQAHESVSDPGVHVTVVEREGRFVFRGSDLPPVEQGELAAALAAYATRHPAARFELVCSSKRTSEHSNALAEAFVSAKVLLEHHWVPVGEWSDDLPVGPHGVGYVDLLAERND